MSNDLANLVTCGVLKAGQDAPKSYYDFASPVDTVRQTFGISKTVFCRFTLSDCYEVVGDEVLYSIVNVARRIAHVLNMRGQSLPEFVEYVTSQNRRNANSGRKSSPKKADQILAIIHRITKDHPKARGVFEHELQKIGVSLPKINP